MLLEILEEVKRKMSETWDMIRFDILPCFPNQTMSRNEVIDVVLNRVPDYLSGQVRECYNDLTYQSKVKIARSIFTSRTYGL